MYYQETDTGDERPDNETDPFWQCYSWDCRYQNGGMSECLWDQCYHNETNAEWCGVDFTDWMDNTYVQYDCDAFDTYNETWY
jgi:hypothetical protein